MGVAPEPGAIGEMIGPPRRDQGPEPGAVAEDAQVGELVDHDGLERSGRREDEAPREHEPAVARGTPPAAPRVTDGDGRRRDPEWARVRRDRPVDRLFGPFAKPRLQQALDGTSLR